MSNVVAIVVTYNRKQLLAKCINALLAQDTLCDILIVDNASTDGTDIFLEANKDQRISFIRNRVNSGGAGGFYEGIRVAVERGYTYLWLMDDDTFPHDDALTNLMDADSILKQNYGFLSSLALWVDGKVCRMNVQKVIGNTFFQIDSSCSELLRVKQATFVSLLVRSETITRVGLPIKEFFIWGDDIEFTRRIAIRHSIPSYLVGTSHVTHATANNCGSNIALTDNRFERYLLAFRNENYLYRQEGIMGFGYYLLKCSLNIAKILFFSKNKKIIRIMVIIRAIWDGISFNPEITFLNND